MTRARDLASGSGIEAGEVVPHIIPGVLYPAVAGKLLDGSTSHGATYGVAQSDGRSYYYTDIKGSKPIKDPRIGGHFGSQRHMFKSIQLLEQETATHGENVFSVDGRDWIRMVGNISVNNSAHGVYIPLDGTGEYVEITGYFNDANILLLPGDDQNLFGLALNGTSLTNAGEDTATTSPLNSRYVPAAVVINIAFSTTPTLGINTIKITKSHWLGLYGIELIAQDTSSTANRSKIQIPSQNVVSYGKKFTVSGTPHYDPFNGFVNDTTLFSSVVDTATSLGLGTATTWGAPWDKGGNDHIRPFNGGRVVKWVDSSGTIKTSVTMMPRNAQNIGTTASNEITTASATNSHTLNFSDDGVDQSLSEVAKVFHVREFGNGAANTGGLAANADASMLYANDYIAFVMDDGLTTLCGKDIDVNTNEASTHSNGLRRISLDDARNGQMDFTFIGTGFSISEMAGTTFAGSDDYRISVDGIVVKTFTNGVTVPSGGNFTVAQNLPYGTHVVRINGVAADSNGFHLGEITFHQPKKPPIPEDAVVLADYMLMADFVQYSGSDERSLSKGVRRIGGSRDHFYDCGGAIGAMATGGTDLTSPFFWNGPASHATNAMAVSLPYFGTSFTSFAEDQSATHTFTLDGSSVTPTEADCDDGKMDLFYYSVSTLGLHTKVHNVAQDGKKFTGTDVASPIHTSSHYETFETPFLHELVGGDRNMEQTNLVVTPDGKTWDQLRDTSYIGNCVVSTTNTSTHVTATSTVCVMEEWRGGVHGKHYYFNKDFAIAYDRMICLVDGQYELHARTIARAADGHAIIKVNGTALMSAHATSQSHDTPHNIIKLSLVRGDYVQVFGHWYASDYWAHFSITRL